MKKLFLFLTMLLGINSMSHADSKLTGLTQDTTTQAPDLFYKVDDPSGTPVSRSISASSLFSSFAVSSFTVIVTTQGNSGLYSGNATTTNLSEGSNLYYTTARSTTAISANAPLSNTNGALSLSSNLPSGSTSYVGSTALYVASVTTNASLNETFTGVSGATVTLSVNVSSISLPNSGVTAGSYTTTNITVDSHGLISSASNGTASGGVSVYPATATASLPFGVSASTVVVNSGTALGILTGASRARFRMGGILSLQNVNADSPSSGSDSSGIFTAAASTSTASPLFYTARRSSGTTASPTATEAGMNMLQISAGGYGTSGWSSGSTGRMDFIAEEKFTDTSMATAWQVQTTTPGSITPTTRMYIGGNGAVTVYSAATFVTRLAQSNFTFSMMLDPIRCKLLSPGTTAFPTIDNSTTTSVGSLYWDSQSTQTATWSQILAPYGGGNLVADFTFSGSSITSGNVQWSVFVKCNGPSSAINQDTVFQNYSLDVSTGGAVPGTAGFPRRLTTGALTLNNSCTEGDLINVLVTRNHNIASDALGNIRLFPSRIREN